MKITRRQLRHLIREQLGGDSPSPPEEEFAEGEDELAGYIVVRNSQDKRVIAHAPITRTNGPDRPFLVRTTDTSWNIPDDIVKMIYPQVEDVLNHVDSMEDWSDLGPGDKGEVGLFEWEWTAEEP